jgi:hypothetical protein
MIRAALKWIAPRWSSKHHQIDWSKVQTAEDLKPFVIAALGGHDSRFTPAFFEDFPEAQKFVKQESD